MAQQTIITLSHDTEAHQTVKDLLLKNSSKPRTEAVALSKFFDAASIGNRTCSFTVEVDSGDAVAASGTITFSSFVADDTVTVGTQTFTAKSSPSGDNQFDVDGGDTAAAAALAAKINAHPSLSRVVTASAASGVITVTSYVKGLIGNQIGIAISAHGSVSGAKLTSGTNATTLSGASTYHCGK